MEIAIFLLEKVIASLNARKVRPATHIWPQREQKQPCTICTDYKFTQTLEFIMVGRSSKRKTTAKVFEVQTWEVSPTLIFQQFHETKHGRIENNYDLKLL